jgi:hypothetical protein
MNPKSARLPGKNDAPVHAGVAGGWLDLDRVRVYSAALLVLFAALLISWGWVSKGFTDATISRPGSDFSVFWGASHLALTQGPLHAYDVGQLTAVIARYGTLGKDSTVVLPWLYPPTFLLMVLPFSLLPLAWSYLRRWWRETPPAVTPPATSGARGSGCRWWRLPPPSSRP